ncbi:MAG: hypothetical protein V3S98_01090 [Dehalococcoidia bacterium]
MATLDVRALGGFMVSQHPEEVSVRRQHELGIEFKDQKGRTWKYARAGEALTGQGYVGYLDDAGDVLLIDTTTDGENPQLVGVIGANEDVADNEFFWMCMEKPASDTEMGIRVAANAAADIDLQTTAVAGELDDAATAVLKGARLLTAQGGSAGVNVTSEWKNMRVSGL